LNNKVITIEIIDDKIIILNTKYYSYEWGEGNEVRFRI
jgi:hypothetical protein